jgi:hypothetical protein
MLYLHVSFARGSQGTYNQLIMLQYSLPRSGYITPHLSGTPAVVSLKVAAGDRFLPAAQRGDWHRRPPFRDLGFELNSTRTPHK